MSKNGVNCLLMGGQACVLYGGAEFSRDIDFVLDASKDNLARLSQALEELKAHRIAVPPFTAKHLNEGLVRAEEEKERQADREYWEPLKRQLWELRQRERNSPGQ